MSAHMPVSQAMGDGIHLAVDGGPPFDGCGRRSELSAPTQKGQVRLHKPKLI